MTSPSFPLSQPIGEWVQENYTFVANRGDGTTAEEIVRDYLTFNVGQRSYALQELLSGTPFPHDGSTHWRKNTQ